MSDAEYEMLVAEIKTLNERVASLESEIAELQYNATLKDQRIAVLEVETINKTHLLRLVRDEIVDEIGVDGD